MNSLFPDEPVSTVSLTAPLAERVGPAGYCCTNGAKMAAGSGTAARSEPQARNHVAGARTRKALRIVMRRMVHIFGACDKHRWHRKGAVDNQYYLADI